MQVFLWRFGALRHRERAHVSEGWLMVTQPYGGAACAAPYCCCPSQAAVILEHESPRCLATSASLLFGGCRASLSVAMRGGPD
jgi:hypothetical protein